MGQALLRHPLYRVHQLRGDREAGARARAALEVQLLTSTTGAPTLRGAPIVALALTGELCAYSAPQVLPILVELSYDATELLLDLSELTLVDAAGLAMFVRLDHVLAQHRGRLHLYEVGPAARSIFDLCGLGDLLQPLQRRSSPHHEHR